MQIYLPIAEVSVDAESLILLGTAVGFLSGVFGVGGGFLTTPFLIFLGIPPSVAVGTQANMLIATSTTGVLGHLRRNNVDTRMGLVMLAGGMVGTLAGIGIFRLLEHFGQIDLFITFSYIGILGTIGGIMLVESLRSVLRSRSGQEDALVPFSARPFARKLPYRMRFPKSRLSISALIPSGVGVIGGLLVSVMGIGGGFLLIPAMIYIIGMPSLYVPGTSLFQIIFISAFACLLHAILTDTVDIILALILMSGGVVGAQLGVRAARHVRGAPARLLLAFIILGGALRLAAELFFIPADLFSIDIR